MAMNTGHGDSWLYDAREDRIEIGDAVLFSPDAEAGHLTTGIIKIIFQNGSVEIAGWFRNYTRWARDVVLNVAKDQRGEYQHLIGPVR
jgi:hypothetical protein